ncbi:50S ribosomal protein L9 [Vallitalea okinawensis]|uniref:50S ribosomal protein L9 n=1 Tax=Vallitalea okinawensis TaxID=2078660 RepID=UPI000CFE2243|nr:50S ribosomal protein L9 [Vallitalea okinawensis]
MEIILLQDVKKLGKKGELVKVSDGYAKNYILPKKLGVEATKSAKNDLMLKEKADNKRKQEEFEAAKQLAEELKEKKVVISVKAGEGGRLFGSVTTKEIAKAAKDQLKLSLDKKKFQLDEPIRSLGNHIIPIKIHPKVMGELTVTVKEL